VIQIIMLLKLLILIMRLWDDDMLFFRLIDSAIDSVLLSVQDYGPRGLGIDGTPWTLDRVGECTIWGLIVSL
jgi:hypothetical protein